LITISIKVNIDPVPDAIRTQRQGFEMKKRPQGKGFWNWLFGSGWTSGGSGG
jgi:hypothetical protein